MWVILRVVSSFQNKQKTGWPCCPHIFSLDYQLPFQQDRLFWPCKFFTLWYVFDCLLVCRRWRFYHRNHGHVAPQILPRISASWNCCCRLLLYLFYYWSFYGNRGMSPIYLLISVVSNNTKNHIVSLSLSREGCMCFNCLIITLRVELLCFGKPSGSAWW